MDILADNKEKIEWHIFNINRNLFNMRVDVVFYDVTTFHFESINSDELRNFGFSKSGHFNEVQVVLGILIDTEGRPIGFNIFPGNTSEHKTFIHALDSLKKRFQINHLIFVADRAMNSKENLYHLREAKYDYIVSARLKNTTQKIKCEIFDKQGYKIRYDADGNELYKYKVIENVIHWYKDEAGNYHQYKDHILVTWSKTRSEHDREERERMIKKAASNLEKGLPIENKKGWKRLNLKQ